MSSTTSEISFKFRLVENGTAQGLLSQNAIANEREIILGKNTSLLYEEITDTTIRDRRLAIGKDNNAFYIDTARIAKEASA